MNFTLFKTTTRKNSILFFIFLAILLFYSTIILSMYNPENTKELLDLMSVMPSEMLKAFGFSEIYTDLGGFLSSFLYGFIMLVFPLIYSILTINKLFIKPVENNYFSGILATPVSRVKIISTLAFYSYATLIVMHIIAFFTLFIVSSALFPDSQLIPENFILVNLGVILVNLSAMSINFLSSCIFKDSKLALGVGTGVNIMFFLFDMIGNASEEGEILQNFSIFGIYSPVEIYNTGDVTPVLIPCIIIIFVCNFVGILTFKNKQLTL